jgi:hypothetical protein
MKKEDSMSSKEEIEQLIDVVDAKFTKVTNREVLKAFDIFVYVLLLLVILTIGITAVTLTTPFTFWLPLTVSFVALAVSIYSFMFASKPFVTIAVMRLKLKQINESLPEKDKTEENKILLYPLITMKIEYYPLKLRSIYELSPSLFEKDKLLESFYKVR